MKKIITLLILTLLISCKKEKIQTDFLGTINIEVTGNSKAANYFEKGLV